jgi:amino acid transporter
VAPQDRPSPHTLAPGRLGAAGIVFFALAAATPFSTAGTVIPEAYAHGIRSVPLVFLAVGLVLALFSIGYVAMARRAPNAGALYAVIARGLGRPAGLGSAWIALLSYNAIQISLYGLVGAAAAPLLRVWFGVSTPWWTVAGACWLVVAACGLIRVEIVGALLTLVMTAEIAVLAGYGAANLLKPVGGPIGTAGLDPAPLAGADRPVLGLLVVAAALGFIGFETTAVYGEEARGPRRALAHAAYWVVAVTTLLYAVAAWATSVAVGPDRVVGSSGLRGTELIFELAGDRLAPWAVMLGRALLLTGLVAALVSLHHTIARYMFAMGRERVLPGFLGRTSLRTSGPRAASLTQSLIAALVLAGCHAFDLDPSTRVFARLSVGGASGVLVLLLLASVAALLFLNRNPNGESVWRRFVAPALASVGLGALVYLAFVNLPTLLGVSADSPLVRTVPTVFAAELILGILYAVVLRGARPVVYAGIGLGGTAVVVPPNIPAQRAPGAHRPERIHR